MDLEQTMWTDGLWIPGCPRNGLEMSLRNGVERKWHWTQLHIGKRLMPTLLLLRGQRKLQHKGERVCGDVPG